MGVVRVIVILLRAFILPRAVLAAEILALRHQLGVRQRSVRRPRLWTNRQSSLVIVKPETIVRWHRDGFRSHRRWGSRKKLGRPKIDAEIRGLIRRMSRENATWGSPRIQSELALLGYTVEKSTVAIFCPYPNATTPGQTASSNRRPRSNHRGWSIRYAHRQPCHRCQGNHRQSRR